MRAPFTLLCLALLGLGVSPRAAEAIDPPLKHRSDASEQRPPPDLAIVAQVGGASNDVAVDEATQRAYFGIGLRLHVVDVSDPTKPLVIGQSEVLSGVIEGLAVSGGLAYVVTQPGGLRILDVADPRSPSEVGALDTPRFAQAVFVAGRYAYVVDETSLRIIDVSEPRVPQPVGVLSVPVGHGDVFVTGGHAYVACVDGLQIVDVADPGSPREAGMVSTPGQAHAVFVDGGIAYVANGLGDLEGRSEGLRIVDVRDPSSPQTVSTVAAEDAINDVFVADERMYLASGSISGDHILRILDVADPRSPSEVGGVVPLVLQVGEAVFVTGTHAYVAASTSGLRILDVTDPRSPHEVGAVDVPSRLDSVFVTEGYAYLSAWNGLRIFDVRSPRAPIEVATLMPDYPNHEPNEMRGSGDALAEVFVEGGYAYVVGMNGLWIVDVTDPRSPRQLAVLPPDLGSPGRRLGALYERVFVTGGYAYAVGKHGLRVIDVTDPRSPREVGAALWSVEIADIFVDGGYAYVSDPSGGLWIYDVTDPRSPRQVKYLDAPGMDGTVFVVGEYAYLFGSSGLRIIDITDPRSPEVVGTLNAFGAYLSHAFVADGFAYMEWFKLDTPRLGSIAYGRRIVDVTDPRNPHDVASLDLPCYVRDMFVTGGYAYFACYAGGLVVAGPRVPPPTATAPPLPATPTLSPTQTPSATSTPPPPTPAPRAVFLPLLLREEEACPPVDIFSDIVLVIDTSTSMTERTAQGRTKLEAGIAAARAFIDRECQGLRLRPGGDQVAVVAFNSQAVTLQPLSSDRALLHAALGRVAVQRESNIDLGILQAAAELAGPRHGPGRQQAIVLLSDGISSPRPGRTAVEAARSAKDAGILLYVIGIGPSMDEAVLRAIASRDDYFTPAPDAESLPTIYSDLVVHILCPAGRYWGGRDPAPKRCE